MKHYLKWAVSQWDRVIGWTCVFGGALLTLSGALNVSRARDQLDQLSYLASGPAIGLFLLGVGAILILSADLRDEWGKLEEVVSVLGRRTSPGDAPASTAGPSGEISLPDAAAAAGHGAGEGNVPDGGATDVVALRAGFPALAVAGVGIMGGATGVNRSLDRVSALRWTQLSAGSLALALVVVGLCYLRGRREIARGVAGVVGAVAGRSLSSVRSGAVASATDGGWYVVEGSQRYHAAGCDLLRFSEVRPIPADEAADSGLSRCPICR